MTVDERPRDEPAPATEEEAQRLEEFFHGTVGALADAYRGLCDLEIPQGHRWTVWVALVYMSGMALRHLLGAQADIRLGLHPESAAHVRPAWEGVLDMAYLLSHGKRQGEPARVYVDVGFLREVDVVELASGYSDLPRDMRRGYEMLSRERRLATAAKRPNYERYVRLLRKYESMAEGAAANSPEAKRLQHDQHWSGQSRRQIEEQAHEYMVREILAPAERLAPEEYDDSREAHLRSMLYGIPSKIIHVDPSIAVCLPRDETGLSLADPPTPDSRHMFLIAAVDVALRLLLCLAKFLGPEEFERAAQRHRESVKALGLAS